MKIIPYAFAILFVISSPATAYIGPGAGIGALAVILALAFGLVLLIVGLVWYPLKRVLKSRKTTTEQNDTSHNE